MSINQSQNNFYTRITSLSWSEGIDRNNRSEFTFAYDVEIWNELNQPITLGSPCGHDLEIRINSGLINPNLRVGFGETCLIDFSSHIYQPGMENRSFTRTVSINKSGFSTLPHGIYEFQYVHLSLTAVPENFFPAILNYSDSGYSIDFDPGLVKWPAIITQISTYNNTRVVSETIALINSTTSTISSNPTAGSFFSNRIVFNSPLQNFLVLVLILPVGFLVGKKVAELLRK